MQLTRIKAVRIAPPGSRVPQMQVRRPRPTMHRLCACRTELCSRDGRLLRAFNFDRDCEGGPHEASPRLAAPLASSCT